MSLIICEQKKHHKITIMYKNQDVTTNLLVEIPGLGIFLLGHRNQDFFLAG